MPEDPIFDTHLNPSARTTAVTNQKWGGLASFLLAVTFIVPQFIYLVGNLRSAYGPFAYSLADLLAGPVWAASLVMMVFTLREQIGEHAPRRLSLAFLAAAFAAGAMVAVACIRAANRHYHLIHPELHLENSIEVLAVWTTLVGGISAVGWHFLGWTWLLIGWESLTPYHLPRLLTALYWMGGAVSLFVFVWPDLEGPAGALSIIISIWQGILLWRAEPDKPRISMESLAL
jgi:hypothetical protein